MDLADKVDFEIRRAEVAKLISCPVTGEVLDVRTAVGIVGSNGNLVTVVSPEGYRQRKDALIASIPGITFQNAPAD